MDSECSAAQHREAKSCSIRVNFFKMKKQKYLDTDIDYYLTSDD